MDYFITKGIGESNLKSDSSNETTTFDDALVNAGIGNTNLILYSSIIPFNSKEVAYRQPAWGEVLECILARKDGKKGQFISSGLLINYFYNGNNFLGGLVLEYSGKDTYQIALNKLNLQLNEMIIRRNYQNYRVQSKFIFERTKVKKKFGTVFCTICFKRNKF